MIFKEPAHRPKSKKLRQKIREQQKQERVIKQKRESLYTSFVPYVPTITKPVRITKEYNSVNVMTAIEDIPKPAYNEDMAAREQEAIESRKKLVISIPYNKGPYMVVPEEDIKHIGKK